MKYTLSTFSKLIIKSKRILTKCHHSLVYNIRLSALIALNFINSLAVYQLLVSLAITSGTTISTIAYCTALEVMAYGREATMQPQHK